MEAVGHWLLFVCNLLGLEVVVGGESIGPFGTCTRLDLFFICVAVLLCVSQISTINRWKGEIEPFAGLGPHVPVGPLTFSDRLLPPEPPFK